VSVTPIAVDLFSGAGGVTTGLRDFGVRVLAAVELDPVAAATYLENHGQTKRFLGNINDIPPDTVMHELDLAPGELTLLTACAPCQGFSSLGRHRAADARNDLVMRVVDFVEKLRPRTLALENVPYLARNWRFAFLLDAIRHLGYGVWHGVANAADFGVPQRRKRLVLLAIYGIQDYEIPPLIAEPVDPNTFRKATVREAFVKLPELDSGDELHVSRTYPPKVFERIQAIPKDGGSRKDLPPHLQLPCHEQLGSGSGSVYGRMRWDDVAPTLTTRCTSPSCGRFLHPEEDRAITLREAAALQTFPSKSAYQNRS
jgi:DNA (cytosine-5)-methyltransferase 1